MGMLPDRSQFWLNLNVEHEAIKSIRLTMKPWNEAMSTAREATATYLGSLGYDILRLHGTRCQGTIDGEDVKGTAYFQKVCVQAPSVPWYWGMLHLSDGSYIDWFLPHLSTTILSRDPKEWKRRDISHIAVSQGGLFHDAKRAVASDSKLSPWKNIGKRMICLASAFNSRMGEQKFASRFVQSHAPRGFSPTNTRRNMVTSYVQRISA